MKSKTLVLMFVAIGCGLVAAYLTARLTANPAEEKEWVLVANTEIKIGTVVKEPEKLFVQQQFPKGFARGAVNDMEKFKDKIVTRTVRTGDYIRADDLSANFGIVPPKGTKAMAIKVKPEEIVGGFVMPGSRVDVMARLNRHNSEPEVQTVLQNQEVLAVDQSVVRPDGQSASATVNTVSLAVKPEDAMRLEWALGMSGGSVRLLLRDQNDTEVRPLRPVKNLDRSPDSPDADPSLLPPTAVKVFVALEDIKPGTRIEDATKFFKLVPMAQVPERAFSEKDLDKLKGLTVKVHVFKEHFLTGKHFEGGVTGTATAATPAKPVDMHVMFISNGGKQPEKNVYVNGQLEFGGDNTPKPAAAPAPVTPTPKDDQSGKRDRKDDENKNGTVNKEYRR